jgi:hypothetical protein
MLVTICVDHWPVSFIGKELKFNKKDRHGPSESVPIGVVLIFDSSMSTFTSADGTNISPIPSYICYILKIILKKQSIL